MASPKPGRRTRPERPPGRRAADAGRRREGEELQALVAPIALDPDLVLVLTLQASLAPLDIVQGARFLARYAQDPSLTPDPDWDQSGVGLLNYPTVIHQMNADLDWTRTLGQAVLDQVEGVQDAVQDVRSFMRAVGELENDARSNGWARERPDAWGLQAPGTDPPGWGFVAAQRRCAVVERESIRPLAVPRVWFGGAPLPRGMGQLSIIGSGDCCVIVSAMRRLDNRAEPEMALHFESAEFLDRKAKALRAMAERELDALLMFKQESMYWLTGYDSFGYCFFQCLVLRADGDLVLLTRAPDLRQAQHTSLLADIRIWVDRADSNPAEQLGALLADKGLSGKALGIEYDSYGLTAANGRRVDAALDGFAPALDASDLVDRLRLVKSPAEIACVRRAAELADAALEAAIAEARAGADEAAVLAAMQGAVFRGGGDYPGNPFIIGSGRDALLCRYKSGRRRLDPQDQLTLEFAGVWRQYHACLMRTLVVGEPTPRQLAMHAACHDALLACEAKLLPGTPMGVVFDAHAKVLDAHGMRAHRFNACGYSLGTVYAPCWMDWPMFFAANPVEVGPGMVFFLHMILMDSEAGLAMTLGRTSLITEGGPEPLSKASLELILR